MKTNLIRRCLSPGYVLICLLAMAIQSWSCSNSQPDVANPSYPRKLPNITFAQSSDSVGVYDFLEVALLEC